MKKRYTITIIAFILHTYAMAQTPYISSINDRKETILNGIITKYALQNNSAFATWYTKSNTSYTPTAATIAALEATKTTVHYVIFGGTWCEDTQNILPKFFKLQELAGVSDKAISFYGVDRSKTTLGGLQAAFGITNVPTIIVMKNGKEVGRVVEYGKSGKWDDELAAIIKLP